MHVIFSLCRYEERKKVSQATPMNQGIVKSELCHRIFLQVCKSSCRAYVIIATMKNVMCASVFLEIVYAKCNQEIKIGT